MSTLNEQSNNVKSELKQILSKQKYLCVTADVWTSRAQSYLGVTVHFLNANFDRESYVLAFKQMLQRQTYAELARTLNEIFADYGIKKGQITNIVTDGGSSFCKMFKKYGSEIDAVVIVTNDEECEDGLNDDNIESDVIRPYMEDDNGESYSTEILTFDINDAEQDTLIVDSTDVYLGDYIETDDYDEPIERIELPPQRRCLPHLLNLLAHDFDKILTGNAKTVLVATLNKLHSLWVLTHRSSRAKEICKEVLGKCLLIPCATRWNSKFDAVQRCNEPEVQKNLNTLIQRLKSEIKSAAHLQNLTNNDFSVMKHYINVMKPVAQSLDTLQGEYNSSQGFILPVLVSLKHRVSIIETTTNIIRDFKAAMLKVIDDRFRNYFSFGENNKDLLLASLTIPKFKTNFISNDDDIIYAKNLLIEECKKLNVYNEGADNNLNEAPPTEDSDFLISFATAGATRRNSVDHDIESEVSRFLCDTRIDTTILNEYPRVRAVFFKYNTTLASSAPVERVFSQSLMIFTPRRNKLSALHFEQALLLKHNRSLIDAQKKKNGSGIV